ncbi:MAG: PrpF domain-containing protein [Candidatus Bathyarchaeia archaeon]
MNQIKIPCSILRGGTSKAVFIMKNELPSDPEIRDKVILAIFGSPDIRQIDGLGGADPLTSKLAIIGPPTRKDADIDYTFAQVGVTSPIVDYSGNCGNISSAVGPYAIDKGLVHVTEPVTVVRIHNTNSGNIITAEVPVVNGKSAVEGNLSIDGVPGEGAQIKMDWSDTMGAFTGKLFPTGNVKDLIDFKGNKIEVSIVDAANLFFFCKASDLGLKGTETPEEIDSDATLLKSLEDLRKKVSKLILGRVSPIFPCLIFCCKPTSYKTYTGKTIRAEDVDVVCRMMFMGMMHKAYAGTATVATAVAAKTEGTVVNDLAPSETKTRIEVRIGHPAGIIVGESVVMKRGSEFTVKRAVFYRTARWIMDGTVFVRQSVFK